MPKNVTARTIKTKKTKTSPPVSHEKTVINEDYKELIREFLQSPTVKYVAGGISVALLARLAAKLSDRYPELSEFMKENISMMENKLHEFKNEHDASSTKH